MPNFPGRTSRFSTPSLARKPKDTCRICLSADTERWALEQLWAVYCTRELPVRTPFRGDTYPVFPLVPSGMQAPAAGCERHTALGLQTGESCQCTRGEKLCLHRSPGGCAERQHQSLWLQTGGSTHRSVVMMSASRRRTAAPLGRITESNKARAHWIDLIRDAR